MDDLIRRLREWSMVAYEKMPGAYSEIRQAADTIEAQAAEIARLREALSDAVEVIESCNATFLQKWGTTNKWRNGILEQARQALQGTANDPA